jgi:hypothetical protein
MSRVLQELRAENKSRKRANSSKQRAKEEKAGS